MTNETSLFFAKFSLRELVGATSARSASRPGGMLAGIGGGIGGGSGYAGSGRRHYQKSETCSLPVDSLGDDRFDEAAFMAALEEDVRKQITNCGAVIRFRGEIEGDFNSSEFYFEYMQGEIEGRIILAGRGIGNSYRLKAELEEKV